MAIMYRASKEIDSNSLGDLFLSVNWPLGYQPDKLRRAFSRSEQVITAWDGEKLVGLVNTIADGSVTAFVPYLLVNPGYQKQGIGKTLIGIIVSAHEGYERIVLLTEKDTVDFYKKCGFVDAQGIHSMMITHQ
ncbi:MAG: GNAT family N-acetyltransferase [Dehalococcoidales bacterium]|nr:GNAT family N-acetyltransferase [Dehalococcoidales bacterium]